MVTEVTLTVRQRELLHTAGTRFDGDTLPAAAEMGIRGGAYGAMTEKLQQIGLLEGDANHLRLTAAAYVVLGIRQESAEPQTDEPAPQVEEAEDCTPEAEAAPESPKPRKQREGTKQAKIIEMLKRDEGATLAQIMEATSWQMHTARAVLSRTIQKDLGIALVSEKTTGGERVYRVQK